MRNRAKDSTQMNAEDLSAWFAYDATTGRLTWAKRPARCMRIGDEAGAVKADGYVVVSLGRRSYQAHRIAWAIAHGRWPEHQIDHIDGNRANNRLSNLRDVPQSVNMQNQRRAMASNRSSSSLGVHYYERTKRWKATLGINGRNKYLGYFATEAEASAAYLAAKRTLHAGCTI